MTEREYVEHILKRAEDYIAAIKQEHWDNAEFFAEVEKWERAKQAISAFTLRDVCRVWLEQDALTGPATRALKEGLADFPNSPVNG